MIMCYVWVGAFLCVCVCVGILLIEWVGGVRPNSHQAFAVGLVANGCDPKMMAQSHGTGFLWLTLLLALGQ